MPASRSLYSENLRRQMVRQSLKMADVVAATGLDERTIRSVLRGTTRPHTRTLHKLAAGLDIDVDELFYDPRTASARFDRAANPAAAQIVDRCPKLFAGWTTADFEDLFSRVAVGGELTESGALAAAETINLRRELMTQAAVILESEDAELFRELVALLYRRVTMIGR